MRGFTCEVAVSPTHSDQQDGWCICTTSQCYQLKPDKKDSVYDISSDFYLNAPPELIIHLTHLIRLYFSHGFIPQTVLMCTLIPLVKDNLGDVTSSENYRAIAGGCLLIPCPPRKGTN